MSTKIPNRVKLFKSGPNNTTKGTFIYNPTLIKEIKKNQDSSGKDKLPVDIAHLSLGPSANPDSHISVGWFELELKPDGIYAKNIKWTERGKQYLSNREFRFISPAFQTNSKNEIIHIENFALTNNPATLKPIPIVASNNNKEIITMSEELACTPEDEKKKLEDMPMEEDVSIDEKDQMILDLTSQVDALKAELVAAQEKIAEFEAGQVAAEKDSTLASVALSDAEKTFYKTLSLEQVKQIVEIKKLSAVVETPKKVIEEVVEEKVIVSEPKSHQLAKSPIAPAVKETVVDKRIPSLANIQQMAERIASQRGKVK
jgi:phage I-like protein